MGGEDDDSVFWFKEACCQERISFMSLSTLESASFIRSIRCATSSAPSIGGRPLEILRAAKFITLGRVVKILLLIL